MIPIPPEEDVVVAFPLVCKLMLSAYSTFRVYFAEIAVPVGFVFVIQISFPEERPEMESVFVNGETSKIEGDVEAEYTASVVFVAVIKSPLLPPKILLPVSVRSMSQPVSPKKTRKNVPNNILFIFKIITQKSEKYYFVS